MPFRLPCECEQLRSTPSYLPWGRRQSGLGARRKTWVVQRGDFLWAFGSGLISYVMCDRSGAKGVEPLAG
jgi:hypothetical protein